MDKPVLANQQKLTIISSVYILCYLKDLLWVMDDRDEWQNRIRERKNQGNLYVHDDHHDDLVLLSNNLLAHSYMVFKYSYPILIK